MIEIFGSKQYLRVNIDIENRFSNMPDAAKRTRAYRGHVMERHWNVFKGNAYPFAGGIYRARLARSI